MSESVNTEYLRTIANSLSYNETAETLLHAASYIEKLENELAAIKTSLVVILNDGVQPKQPYVIMQQPTRKNNALHELRGNITMCELAQELNIHERTIYKWFDSDLLPNKRLKIVNAILKLQKNGVQ